MSFKVFTPSALKLFKHSITCLLDQAWLESNLATTISLHRRGEKHPIDLLHKTLPNGLLYHIGILIFKDYFLDHSDIILFMEPFKLREYIQDFLDLLSESGCQNSRELVDLVMILDEIEEIWEEGVYKNHISVFKRRN